jgi:hypothetical protein
MFFILLTNKLGVTLSTFSLPAVTLILTPFILTLKIFFYQPFMIDRNIIPTLNEGSNIETSSDFLIINAFLINSNSPWSASFNKL